MAYVNVADWKPDQVADWLKGLDLSIHRYVESFLNNHVNGQHLLNLQPDDLEHHGIYKVGHQEIILEAVDHLRNFHYELDHENLQLLALRVSCLAHSLQRELQWNNLPGISTQTLSDVATLIKAVKPLVCWLDRPPFSGQLAYIDKKAELLKLSVEMAFIGQRGKFADQPIVAIRNSAKRLAELADEMIREIHDPLLLQPSSLDLATLKKRPGDHLGFCIIPSFYGIHQIGDIKCNSSAYQSGKIECGDEIVQINYQTVVGWDVKQVIALFEESSSDIFLTLKKRPCHSKILGQIYMKPYRLPSKKQVSYGWFLGDNITPPRINHGGHFDIKPLGHKLSNSVTSFSKNRKLLTESFEKNAEDVKENERIQSKIVEKEEPVADLEEEQKDVREEEEEEDDDDEDNEPEEEESISSPTSVRLYLPKPRLPVQRRATITGTGASPTSKRAPLNLEQLWHELKLEREWRLSGKQSKGEKSTSEILLSTTSPSEVGSVESKINLKSAPKACSADCLKSVQSDFVKKNKPHLHFLDSKFTTENETLEKSQKESNQEPKKANDNPLLTEETNLFIPLKERIEALNKKIDDSSAQSLKSKGPNKRCVQNEGFMSLTNSPAHRSSEKKPIARPRGKLDKANSTPVYDFNEKPQVTNEIELLLKNRLKSRNTQGHSNPELKDKVTSNLGDDTKHPCDGSQTTNNRKSILSPSTTKKQAPDVNNDEILPELSSSEEAKSPATAPRPAARTLKTEARNVLSDSDVKSKLVLLPTDMHISDSKDSVFIEDDVVINANTVQLVSPERKKLHDIASKQQSSKVTIHHTSHEMKFIDEPESPTDPPRPKTHATVVIGSPDVPAPSPSIPQSKENILEKQVSLVSVGKMKEVLKPDPSILSLNKEELLKKPAVDISSSIFYMPENMVKVSVPDDQTKINLSSSSSAEAVNKVHFASSTPIKKQFCQETSFCQQSSTYPRNKPEIKSVLPGPSTSQSSSLRAIIPIKSKNKATSPKVFRKKNSLLRGKRRNISVKDLVMPDCEGWLFQRDRKISAVPQWIRGWFVIKGNHFYGFIDKDSVKANLFIYLPGFTVAPAIEVKSRKYALKIYHTGTTFYLAADSQDEFSSWLGCLSQAIIAHDRSPVENITFSESEGEDKSSDKSDSDKSKEHCFSSPTVKKMSNFLTGPLSSSISKSDKRFSSLKKKKEDNHHSSEHGNSSLDRKYLRFLSGTKNNVPVPTEHFRSYRRVPPANMSDKLPSHDTSVTSVESAANRTSSPLQLPPEMADYRLASLARAGHTTNRQREHNTTLEAFMLSRQGEERRQNQNASALRPPQHAAPSAPRVQDETACRTPLAMPSTSQKDTDCRMSSPLQYDWSETMGESSHARNCNTIPDIQTKRLKKITAGNMSLQPGTSGDSNSLYELEESSDRSNFQRNTSKSSSSSKLKSFFSSSHWQDSSSKGILGSPRLRRVLFRDKADANIRVNTSKCHPTSNSHNETSTSNELGQHTPDYPGLEYPPVFVPESYSLSYVTSILEARASPNSNNPHDSETASNEGDPPSPL